ncbi:TRAP-type C4-dicarboxylate transport system, small permease component [Meinhardsimonia xiamenensis]|jgi:TRAP-type C4-dicarboxylate transport system permease small subunit|uniref:TRAP transporter small permease protein n=1 Tax=Meinhardsimonia xiamenensis TaxID=990712 RepID=A0A1G9DA51_9RHOB|nr:TRAP transporter small permease subunit [Meinhardsimonia xiamenensis]PRX38073.1 TRAP-type C4-dicarboxylate transport system permease small subunit [Meinhardsimonia xiamenensis]SDK60778.1 TRAP-type C4-dicarboxylate transport system, small permease component [Meinhardsimonia xiamenensis]
MDRLRRIAGRLAVLVNHLTAGLLLSMFVVFLLQILFRYVLGWPVLWTVEWVTIAWLWGILLAFAFVLTPGEMIRLDILYNAAPRGARRAMDVFVGLVTAAIFAWTLPHAWDYVTFMKIERTAAFQWRFDLVFAVYIPFHIAVIVRMLALVWAGIAGDRPRAELEPRPETHDYD